METAHAGYRKPKTEIVIPPRVAEKAATRYIEDTQGCWISTYSVASHGYAQIGWQESGARFVVTAHRAAWVYKTGSQIGEGLTIDHTCWNRRCVNPEHLRDLPNFENARRTRGRDWALGTCVNGHSNEELVDRSGKRACRVCMREWGRKYRLANPEKVKASQARYNRSRGVSALATQFDPIEEASDLLTQVKALLPPMSQRQLSVELGLMRPTIRKIEKASSTRVEKSVTRKLREYIERL